MSASLPLDILLKYKGKSKIFFETGTEHGETVQTALDAEYEDIYSVEINEEMIKIPYARFQGDKRVHILLGDSVTVMRTILSELDKSILFWLDAHPGHWTAGTPILGEIQAIKDYCKVPVTILVDDMRLMGSKHWVDVTVQKIIDAVHEIDPNFMIYRENNEHAEPNDIFVAFRDTNV